jgi:hypothetical protein
VRSPEALCPEDLLRVGVRVAIADGTGLGNDQAGLLSMPAFSEDAAQHRSGQHGQQRSDTDDGADLCDHSSPEVGMPMLRRGISESA